MDRREILESKPCQELFYRVCELLEERLAVGLDSFLQTSCFGKETALRELGYGKVLLLLTVHSLAQGDAFLSLILVELAQGYPPLDSPFLADWLSQDFRIEQEMAEKALRQAIRLNNGGVVLVPDAILQILIKLAKKSGIEVIIDDGAETGSWWEGARGTSQLQHSVPGPSKLEEPPARRLLVESEETRASEEGSAPIDLHTAASMNSRDVVQALLEKGEPVGAVNSDGQTPMALAVKKDFPAIVDVLLKKKADIRWKNGDGDSYVHVAAASHSPASLRMLLEYGAPVDSVNKRRETPLAVAVKQNDPEIIKVLVEFGADVKRKTGGETYLHEAVKEERVASLRALLECGMSPDVGDSDGKTPIILAVEKDDTQSADVLTEFGAEVKQRWSGGGNLLHCAATNGSSACIVWLVQRGLDVNSTNTDGYTPLHFAAFSGKLDAAMMLVQLNCDLNSKTHRGWTPLRVAQDNPDLAAYLRSVGGRM